MNNIQQREISNNNTLQFDEFDALSYDSYDSSFERSQLAIAYNQRIKEQRENELRMLEEKRILDEEFEYFEDINAIFQSQFEEAVEEIYDINAFERRRNIFKVTRKPIFEVIKQ